MTAAEKLITENLGVWSSAIKQKATTGRGSSSKHELYGIKKLRDLILELAVRGLLVPQDSGDESASILLEKIKSEKKELQKNKKVKGKNKLEDINESEKPFILPKGWIWLRFGNLYEMEYGDNLPKAKRSETGEYPVYGSNGIVGSHNKPSINGQCVVVGRKGSAGALNLSLAEGCWVTDVAYSITPSRHLDINFVFQSLHTLGLDSLGKGIKPGLNRNEAYELVLALPPFQEQKRIVAKVDELMALCDQLEQQQENSINAHQALVETLLGALTNASEKGEFDTAWARIADHFDTLFTTEHSIDQLKQTILQLAVMGKLVPQDPGDEPASELLEKIAAENAIKTRRRVPEKVEMDPDVEAWKLPVNWEVYSTAELLRNGMIKDLKDGNHGSNHPVKADWTSEGLPFITAAQVNDYKIDYEGAYKLSGAPLEKLRVGFSDPGDVIYTHKGSVGRTAINTIPCVLSPQTTYYRLEQSLLFNKYLMYYFQSGLFTNQVDKVKKQTTRDFVAITKQYLFFVIVPPLEEQKRIVRKIDKLLTICDQLKNQINSAKTIQLYLADAIGQQLFGHQMPAAENESKEDSAMKIITELSLDNTVFDDSAIIAPLVKEADGSADAKEIWGKTKLELPAFYQQLKKEIDAGFICKPAQAEFDS